MDLVVPVFLSVHLAAFSRLNCLIYDLDIHFFERRSGCEITEQYVPWGLSLVTCILVPCISGILRQWSFDSWDGGFTDELKKKLR